MRQMELPKSFERDRPEGAHVDGGGGAISKLLQAADHGGKFGVGAVGGRGAVGRGWQARIHSTTGDRLRQKPLFL